MILAQNLIASYNRVMLHSYAFACNPLKKYLLKCSSSHMISGKRTTDIFMQCFPVN